MATISPTRVQAGRGVEVALLVVALVVGIYSYAMVGIGVEGSVPADVWQYGLGMAVLAVGAHLVVRWRAPHADPVILPVVVALNGIGLAMIYRIDLAYAARGRPHGFADKQLLWTAVSVVGALLLLWLLRDHRKLRRYTYTAMVASLALLLSPMIPGIGQTINGAQIWVRVGPVGMQPAELAKITLAVFFAGYLVTNRDTLALAGRTVLGMKMPRVRDLGPILLIWVVAMAVLVMQRDLGAALLFFGLFVAMIYLATERISWVVIGLGLFGVGAAVAARAFSHVGARFDGWLDAFNDEVFNRHPGGSGQLVRGLFGMASGGMFGTGWGQGRPDLVPYAESDFIVASLGEELGLTGLTAILLLVAVLVQRGMRTAIGVRDGFGKLLAGGLSFLLVLQVFVVVGGVTRLIPLTGLATPFLAYGGSSLFANWLIVALLLRVSDDARRPAPDVRPVLTPEAGTPVVVAGAATSRPVSASAASSAAVSSTADPPTEIVDGGADR
ncbi:MAG: FtsW/RodA/SpoVE family cell cycle protein [Micrococcales bacterium]|nr:FtsW/RodA/SpoVE family cell cycle protein [Micrococcales bacterium]